MDVRGRTRTPTRTWQEISAEPVCVVMIQDQDFFSVVGSVAKINGGRNATSQPRGRSVTEGRLRPSRVVWQADECNNERTTCSFQGATKQVNQSSSGSNGKIARHRQKKDPDSAVPPASFENFRTTKTGDVDNGSMREAGSSCSTKERLAGPSHISRGRTDMNNNYSHPHERGSIESTKTQTVPSEVRN